MGTQVETRLIASLRKYKNREDANKRLYQKKDTIMKKVFLFVCGMSCLMMFNAWAADTDVLATLNGQPITDGEVLKDIQGQLLKVQSEIYDIKKDAIDQIINEKLLDQESKKQGTTTLELIKKLQKKVTKTTESEAQVFYDAQKARFKGKSFADVKEKLITDLTSQKQQKAVGDFVDGLRAKAKITMNIERPKINVTVDDDPSKGPKDAPVVLIEFSDFQCPFCKRARDTINKILTTYGDKVYYVFRDYPLSFHPQAKGAANAAQCAGDQGKYWEYNTALWVIQGQQTPEKLTETATTLGLDAAKFKSCMDTNKYFSEIDKDQQEAMKAGISGSPAYSINGVFVSGAQPFENFKEIIDEELKKKGL